MYHDMHSHERAVSRLLADAAAAHQRMFELAERGVSRKLFESWEEGVQRQLVPPELERAFFFWAQAPRSWMKEYHRPFYTATIARLLREGPGDWMDTPERRLLEEEAERLFRLSEERRRQPGWHPSFSGDDLYEGTEWMP